MDQSFTDLLKKWLSGDFRRADGERLQSLTEGDAFRREAFEGFAEQGEQVTERQVSAMRSRFEKKYGRKTGGRSVPMTWMLAAAACGLLVFGTVWLFEKTGEATGGGAGEIAMQKEAQPAENQPVAPSMDGPGIAEPSAVLGEKKLEQLSQKRRDAAPAIETKPVDDLAEIATSDEQPAEILKESSAAAQDREAAPAATATAPPPPVRAENRAEEADNYRNQNYQNAPRSLPSDQNAGAKQPAKKPAAAPPPAPKTEGELSEVVVAGADKAKKSSEKKRDKDAAPAPVVGWDAFKNYVRQNLRQPVEAQINIIKGSVGLRFYIDRDGRPSQILVEKSLGGGCDEEAVRLLESGPAWGPVKREARVEIEFK